MNAKQIHEERGQKTFIVVFDTGDEFVSELANFAKKNNLTASSITAIGAFSGVNLGYFDLKRKEYEKILLEEQVEVLSLVGDIALKENGEPQVHAPRGLRQARRHGEGEHLLEAHVRPIVEFVVTESPETCSVRPTKSRGYP